MPGWVPPVLTFVFACHVLGFGVLAWRRRSARHLLLVLCFLFLTALYGLRSAGVPFAWRPAGSDRTLHLDMVLRTAAIVSATFSFVVAAAEGGHGWLGLAFGGVLAALGTWSWAVSTPVRVVGLDLGWALVGCGALLAVVGIGGLVASRLRPDSGISSSPPEKGDLS